MYCRKGKILVLEGLDGGGKHTQSTLLVEKLQAEGYESELVSFPMYETSSGKLIAAYLRGEFGGKKDLPVEVSSLFYTLDRYQASSFIKQELSQGKILVLDRYSPSNLAFQAVRIPEGSKREKFLQWLKVLESRLPQPDMVFYLKVPLGTLREWVKTRSQRPFEAFSTKDIYEGDFVFQMKVNKIYLSLAEKENWEIIDYGNGGDKRVKSRKEVHKEIWKRIKEKLLTKPM